MITGGFSNNISPPTCKSAGSDMIYCDDDIGAVIILPVELYYKSSSYRFSITLQSIISHIFFKYSGRTF